MKKFSSIMKANSRRTSQSKAIQNIVLLGVGALVLLLLVPVLLSTFASFALTPFIATKVWLTESSASLPQFFRDRKEIIDENAQLRAELSGVGWNDSTIQSLLHENQELRALLGHEGEERILAGVIGRPHQLPYDVLMLDRGSNDGIVLNAPVFISNNTVIGIVRSVTPQSALVELVTTPGFETTVFVIGPNVFTTAEGLGGGQLRVGIPQGIPLLIGNVVVIPSIASGVYGEITHIESSPSQPEQYGYVSAPVPMSGLRLVSVGMSPVTSASFEEAQEILTMQREQLLVIPVPEDLLIDLDSGTTSASTSTTSDADMSPVIHDIE